MAAPQTPFSIASKKICITGGASGIGLCTAHLLSSLGAKVSIGDLSGDALQEAADAIRAETGGEVMTMVIDVRKKETVKEWIEETVRWAGGGKIDGAANLAGVIGKNHGKVPIKDFEDDEWDFIMDINLRGVMHCMRAELAVMNEGGSIVNAASICGLVGLKNAAAYCASKHGVIGLTRAVAKEVGDESIRVNCIAPGVIETPMLGQSARNVDNVQRMTSHTAIKRMGDPKEVANLVAFLLSDASRFITGVVYSVDGGWNC